MATYSKEEVKKHSTLKSLWIVHDDNVYDVTDFAERHPGGDQLLLGHGASDVSDFMRGRAPEPWDHDHSKAAYTILKKYYIGRLKGATEVIFVLGFCIYIFLHDMMPL